MTREQLEKILPPKQETIFVGDSGLLLKNQGANQMRSACIDALLNSDLRIVPSVDSLIESMRKADTTPEILMKYTHPDLRVDMDKIRLTYATAIRALILSKIEPLEVNRNIKFPPSMDERKYC